MHLRLLALIAFVNAAFPALQDHFKKPMDKDGPHQMRNIDFIYMINLDRRPEKFERSSLVLSFYGVYPYRFSAVNGWELPFSVLEDVGVKLEPWMSTEQMGTYYYLDAEGKEKFEHEIPHVFGRTYFCHCMSRGSIGIALSHLSILQDAYDSGYETIWVMEDDIDVVQSVDLIPQLIDDLDGLVGKGEWDILFTDQDTKNNDGNYVPCASYAWRPNFQPQNPGRFAKREEVGSGFRKIGSRYGIYSMIVRRSGMKKLLDFMKTYQIFLPFDMEFTQPNDIKIYCVTCDVVSTVPNSPSDNGAPNYKGNP